MRLRHVFCCVTVIAWSVACASSETTIGTPTGSGNPVTSSTTPASPATAPPSNVGPQAFDATTTTPGPTQTCDELGDLSGSDITAAFDNGDQWFWGPLSGRPTATRL